jgi:hypothetical protein
MFVSVQEHARDRHSEGTRRAPSRHLLQFLLGIAASMAGGVVGVALSCVLVWLFSPRPFLSSCWTTRRRLDIHLICRPELLVVCAGSDGRGTHQRLLPAIRACG